jgi:hypothetical protein
VPSGGGAHALVAPVTVDLPLRFAAASNASTPKVYEVPHARDVKVKADVLVVPTEDPLRYSVYPVTPTLSVEAAHATVTLAAPLAVTWTLAGAEGAVVSGGAGGGQEAVEAVIEVGVDLSPAALAASTESEYVVPQDRPVNVAEVAFVLPAKAPERYRP